MNDELTEGEKLLLALLYAPGKRGQAGEPIFGRVTLAKLLFLLWKNPATGRRLAEAHFEPYDYGPWSDWVDVTLDELSSRSLVTQQAGRATRIGLTRNGKRVARTFFDGLSPEERSAVEYLKAHFGSLGTDALLRRIYAAYPEYATQSKWIDTKGRA